MGFTSLYLGGTFAILGINPFKKFKELKAEKQRLESGELTTVGAQL